MHGMGPTIQYFKNRSYYFFIFSQRSADCPCPLPFPGDLVELGPNPNSMACENPGLFIPSGRFPLTTFQGILRLLLEVCVGGCGADLLPCQSRPSGALR